MYNVLYMNNSNKNWATNKIPRVLREEFDKHHSSFPNFVQFAQYAIRKQMETLDNLKK